MKRVIPSIVIMSILCGCGIVAEYKRQDMSDDELIKTIETYSDAKICRLHKCGEAECPAAGVRTSMFVDMEMDKRHLNWCDETDPATKFVGNLLTATAKVAGAMNDARIQQQLSRTVTTYTPPPQPDPAVEEELRIIRNEMIDLRK